MCRIPMFSPSGWFTSVQEAQHRVKIVQRLADAHQHDVGDGQAGIQLGEQHLIQHLRRRQVAGPCRRGWRRRRRSPCGSPPGRRCTRCCRGGTASAPSRCSCRPPARHRYLTVPSSRDTCLRATWGAVIIARLRQLLPQVPWTGWSSHQRRSTPRCSHVKTCPPRKAGCPSSRRVRGQLLQGHGFRCRS